MEHHRLHFLNFRKSLEEKVTGLEEALVRKGRELKEVKQKALQREKQLEQERTNLNNELEEKSRLLKDYQEKV